MLPIWLQFSIFAVFCHSGTNWSFGVIIFSQHREGRETSDVSVFTITTQFRHFLSRCCFMFKMKLKVQSFMK